jgi:plastocyanin
MKRFGIVFAVLAAMSSLSWGLVLTNANFDAQTFADGVWSTPGVVTGWDLTFGYSHAQNLAASSITPEAQSGANTCGLNGQENNNGGAYISQIVKQDDETTPVLVTANKTYKVTMWVGRRTGVEGSFAGILKVYLQETSGATPTNIAEATYDLIAQAQNTWTQQTLYVSTGSNPVGAGSQLRLMLRNVGNRDTAHHWYQQVVLDDVVISDPYIANTPSPANGATMVSVSTMLSWAAPNAFTPSGYNVRIGADPNMSTILATNTSSTTVDPSPSGNLAYNTKYYWRVDTLEPNTPSPIVHTGNVWNFTTIPNSPIITTQPTSQTVAAGTNVEFSITALNTTLYTWYKSADAVVGGDTQVGGNSSTLTLNSVQIADEHYYYCVAHGPTAPDATSNMVTLAIKRQVAHWTLNALGGTGNQYVDSSPEALHPADANGTPTFVAGAGASTGNGVQITPTIGWASVGTWDPSQYSKQITISLWAKWTGSNGDWQGLISKRNTWAADTMMWQVEATQGSGVLDFKNAGSDVSSPALPTGQWEHVAITFDGTTATIYRNGVSAASGTFAFSNKTDANLMIGASEKTDAGVVGFTFNGALDEIQIYNYAMTNTEVVDNLYTVVSDKGACIQSYASAFDIDDDCKVNLSDFAAMAQGWLSCGLYPISYCTE